LLKVLEVKCQKKGFGIWWQFKFPLPDPLPKGEGKTPLFIKGRFGGIYKYN